MEYLVIVFVLAVIGVFILGIISAFSLLGKLLRRLFDAEPPPRPAMTADKPLVVPPSPAAPPRRPVPADASRMDFLFALEREINRGFYSGQISSSARGEFVRFLQQ